MPDPVDPAAEVGRGGDVRADRDHVLRHVRRVVGEVDEEAPERLLGRADALVGAPDVRRHGRRWRELDLGALQPLGGASRELGLGRLGLEQRPRVVRVGAQLLRELPPLLGREQRGVVAGWPCVASCQALIV